MLTVNRISTLSKLTFPIAVGLSSTLVLTLINLSMVGKLGNIAVAAVGLSSFCYTLIVAFVLGVSPAVQGIVARRRGERSQEAKCLPLSAGLTIAVAVGAPLTLVCHLLTPYFY
jgi:multidrug resistance protein, MATE family